MKHLKLAYQEGIMRNDVVIDLKDLPNYIERDTLGDIRILGCQLHYRDVYEDTGEEVTRESEQLKLEEAISDLSVWVTKLNDMDRILLNRIEFIEKLIKQEGIMK